MCVCTQVAWLGTPTIKVSWERACNIQPHLIKEFESKDKINTQDIVSCNYGKQTYTTIAIAQTPDAPVSKKIKSSASTSKPSDIRYVHLL